MAARMSIMAKPTEEKVKQSAPIVSNFGKKVAQTAIQPLIPSNAQPIGDIDPQLLQVLAEPPLLRTEEEMQLVLDYTGSMHYFIQFQQTRDEAKKKIRYDVCRYMLLQHKKRGQIVVQLGDIADRFFIILSGEVLIYKPRSPAEVGVERALAEMVTDYVAKNFSPGEGVVSEELVHYMPKLKPTEEEAILEKFRIVYSDRVEYHEKFLTDILKGGFKYREMRMLPDFFDNKGTLLMGYIGMLNTGCAFGEKGLDERIPRTATIICQSPNAYFGVIMKEEYDRILKEVSVMEHERMRRFVYENVFNKCLSSQISAKIAYELNRFKMSIEADKYLYQQGDQIEWIYLIELGTCGIYHKQVKYESLITTFPEIAEKIQVQAAQESMDLDSQSLQALTKLYKTNRAPKTYNFKLGILSEGALFGFEDIYSVSKRRFYSVKALTDTILYRITRECLERFMTAEPELLNFIKLRCKSINLHRLKLMGIQEGTISTLMDPMMSKLLDKAPNDSKDGISQDSTSKVSARNKPNKEAMEVLFGEQPTEEAAKSNRNGHASLPGAWRKKDPYLASTEDSGKKRLTDKQVEAAAELNLNSMPKQRQDETSAMPSHQKPTFYYDLALKTKQGQTHTLKVAALLATNTQKALNPNRMGGLSSRSLEQDRVGLDDNEKTLGAKLKDIFTGAERKQRMLHKKKLEDLAAYHRVHSKHQTVHEEISKLSCKMALKRKVYDPGFISEEISKIVRRKEQQTREQPPKETNEHSTVESTRLLHSRSVDDIDFSDKKHYKRRVEKLVTDKPNRSVLEVTQTKVQTSKFIGKSAIVEVDEDEHCNKVGSGDANHPDSSGNEVHMSSHTPVDAVGLSTYVKTIIPKLGRLSVLEREMVKETEVPLQHSFKQSVIVFDSDILVKQEEAESLKFEEIHSKMLRDKKLRMDEKIGRKIHERMTTRTKHPRSTSVDSRESNKWLYPGSPHKAERPFDTFKVIIHRHKEKIRKEMEESREWSEYNGPVVLGRAGLSHREPRNCTSEFDLSKDGANFTARPKPGGGHEYSCSAISIQNMGEKQDLSTTRPNFGSRGSLDNEGSARSYRITGRLSRRVTFLDWTRTCLRGSSAATSVLTNTRISKREARKNRELQQSLVIRRFE